MTSLVWVVIAALTVYSGLQFMYALRKYKMRKKEKQFISSRTGPYGSGLSHGMVLNIDNNGVKHDSRKSATWYSRLV
tara:strand:- start:1428 stop:1658 length:231 start_codon:yes stop_codon:yes gene_type:complete